METASGQAQHELALICTMVSDLNFRLQEATKTVKKERHKASKMEAASFAAAEDWKAELEAREQEHHAEMSRLQRVNDHMRIELVAANSAKDEALRLARDGIVAGEIAAKRADVLSSELEKATEAVEVVRQAGVIMVANKEAELKQQVATTFQAKQQSELFRWELSELRQREVKLHEMENEFQIRKEQLAVAKERDHHLEKVVLEENAKHDEAYSEMHCSKTVESEVTAMLSLARAEAEEIRERWKTAHAESCSLTTSLESMTNKLAVSQEQLVKLQERESFACAQAANAEDMLLEVRGGMARAIGREESKDDTVKKLKTLLDEAQSESEMLRQQVFEATFEAELGNTESIARATEREESRDCMVEALTSMLNEASLNAEVLRQQIFVVVFEAQVKAQDLQNDLEASRAIATKLASDLVLTRGVLEAEGNTMAELMALLAEAKLEAQMLRQQIYEAVFEASFGAQKEMLHNEADIKQMVMFIQTVLLEAVGHVTGETQDGHGESLDEAPSLPRAEKLVANETQDGHGESLDEAPSLPRAEKLVANNVTGCGLPQELHSDVRRVIAVCLATANKVASDLCGAREHLDLVKGVGEKRAKLHTEHAKCQHAESGEGMQVKSPELSEPWEMVESGLEAAMVTIKQEEYDILKHKLHEVEELKSMLLEMEPLSHRGGQEKVPSSQLDVVNTENKAMRIFEGGAWQQYVQIKNLSSGAVEVGRPTGGKGEPLWKAWEKGHESTRQDRDPLQSPQQFRLPWKELRLGHHSLSNSLYSELSSSQKEEEECTEFLSLSTAKKKKKPLLLRIGTYLTKQKK